MAEILSNKFRITNTNVRKVFNSMDEVKTYIETEKPSVSVYHKPGNYNIVETVETLHKIVIEPQALSHKNKEKVWADIINNINNLVGDSTYFIYRLLEYYQNGEDCQGRTFPEACSNLEEITKIENENKSKDFFIELIKRNHLAWKKNEEIFDYVKVTTDYKPCHGIGIKFKNGFLNNMFLLKRANDVLFDEDGVYGRNVNHRSTIRLSDKNFK